ncbi:E3 ubiquitin-protein ligase MARCH6 [Acrasis kona]|uniref:RING-type E3 ubiquitin transferase n=1 Tax=Acrasis kona TaxID=1008807 RepID=A0AAW2ZFF8_9EUKA
MNSVWSDNPPEELNPSDDELCRICRQGGTMMRPLYHPCNCSGSIRHVHEDCLIQWINHSNNQTCELCRQQFHFTNIYADNAPERLTITQVLFGTLQMGGNILKNCSRFALVLFMWTFVLPLLTSYVWKLYFAKSLGELYDSFALHYTKFELLKDCLIGSVLSVVILVFGLCISGVKDFVNNNIDLLNEHVNQQPLVNHIVQIEEDAPPSLDDDDDDHDDSDSDDAIDAVREIVNQNIEAPQRLIEDEEVDLEEILGFSGPVGSIFGNCFMIIISNAVHLLVFILIPLSLGRTVSFTHRLLPLEYKNTWIKDAFDIVIGYLFGATLLVALIALNITSHTLFGKPRIYKVTRAAIKAAQYGFTLIKILTVVLLCFFVTPWILGISINLNTSEFFDVTVHQRIDQLLPQGLSTMEPTFLFGLHWILGVVFLFQISGTVRSLRSIIYGPRCLWFFNNPDDPDFQFLRELVTTPITKHARRIVMTHILFHFFVIVLIRAPLKLSRSLFQITSNHANQPWHQLYPLQLNIPDPFLSTSIDICLISLLTQLSINNQLRPMERIKNFVTRWLHACGNALGLEHFLFYDPSQTNQQDAQRIDIYPDYFFMRIVSLLVMAWCTVVALISIAFSVPLIAGRFVLWWAIPELFQNVFGTTYEPALLEVITCNDIYCCLIGLYAVVLVVTVAKHLYELRRVNNMMATICKYGWIGLQCFILFLFLFLLIPLLVGLLAYVCAVVLILTVSDPLSGMQRSPVYIPGEIYAFGLLSVGTLFRYFFMVKTQPFYDIFMNVKRNGLHHLDAMYIFTSGVLPLLFVFTCFLGIPYIMSHLIFGCSDYTYYAYPLLLCLSVAYKMGELIWKSFYALHDRVLNNKYLVRRALINANRS